MREKHRVRAVLLAGVPVPENGDSYQHHRDDPQNHVFTSIFFLGHVGKYSIDANRIQVSDYIRRAIASSRVFCPLRCELGDLRFGGPTSSAAPFAAKRYAGREEGTVVDPQLCKGLRIP
jgi:hypothetical protein